jgi:uncharacterized membrane protein YgaE (UPF0421/DUF939 family)
MPEPLHLAWLGVDRKELIHSLRTTVAAVASLVIAGLFKLSEAYWAAVTTMIVMQSTLGGALTVSKQRLAGTALGAAAGALLATYTGKNVIAFGMGPLILGVICAGLRIERNAYRYAGITLAIVMLVARTEPAWIIAIHRFTEISLGIAVGLVLTAIWPEHDPTGP